MKKNYNFIIGLALVFIFGGVSVFGQSSHYLDFDGSNDYVKYFDDGTLGRMDGATDYTIEAWIYPIDGRVAEYDRVLQRYYSFKITMWDGNNDGNVEDWYFSVSDGSGSFSHFNTQGDATLTLDAWNHIAIINNSSDGSLKLYVNGIDVTQTGGYANMNLRASAGTDNLYIGQKGNGASYFGGYIDEVRLKNTAESIGNLNTSKYGNQYSSDANTACLFHLNNGGYYAINAVNDVKANLGSSTEGDSGEPTWRAWSYVAGQHLPLAHEWIYAISQEWANGGNWGGGLPTSTSDVIIPDGSAQFPDIANSVSATCNNFMIEDNVTVFVRDGGDLTVSGAATVIGALAIYGDVTLNGELITEGGNGNIYIYSDFWYAGSLIHTTSGIGAVIQVYMEGYDDASGNGFHLYSSPVDNYEIWGSNLKPTLGQDDLFYWDESAGDAGMWINYHDGSGGVGFTHLTDGKGYLCSYKNTQHKNILGTMNVDNITFSNMTADHNKWHLLGNPFASALDWSKGSWAVIDVSTPQIYDEDNGDFFPISDGGYNNIIPSAQGFFVQVTDASNTITIPTDARVHSDKVWYKNSNNYENTLCLKLSGGNDSYNSQTTIVFDQTSSNGYDIEYDSHKILGSSPAPKIYTVLNNNENFATNHIPPSEQEILIPTNIKVFSDGEYTIDVKINTIESEGNTYLEDLKTGIITNLSLTDTYTFQANEQDAADRFILHFNSATGISKIDNNNYIHIYANNQRIYLNSKKTMDGDLMIYDMGGKLVYTNHIENSNMQSIPVNNLRGVFMVQFIETNQVSTQKVIIQ